MSDVVIRVEGLGKQYRLGARQAAYPTLRDQVAGLLTSPFRRSEPAETIWALKDVSFEVKQGEVVGIIGRNGAGKSTLLKILSRITEPTVGQVALRGRVGSLLEVGTGFHPELTGRENVFLNGAVLGMQRREIQHKFDEIVAFAEVEKFIDTPVKHYSSGMYMRLAFAVAAHLEPEILIVDEVLAVGDAEFQRKCLGKMGEVAGQGRTVLFVSHNMDAVASLCLETILIQDGTIVKKGETKNVVRFYVDQSQIEDSMNSPTVVLNHNKGRVDSPVLQEIALYVNGQPSRTLEMGDNLQILLLINNISDPSKFRVGIVVEDGLTGQRIFTVTSAQQTDQVFLSLVANKVTCNIPCLPLVPGLYSITITLLYDGQTEYVERISTFTVIARDVFGTGYIPNRSKGMIFKEVNWGIEALD